MPGQLPRGAVSSIEASLKRAATAIRSADALLITAGAGMGVDSGLPDFRGAQGFWRAYPALAKQGISFEEMANPAWFRQDPHLAWAFYGHRLNLYRKTVPHRGFSQLRALGASKPQGYFVFTSNVDGQFQKAGFSASRIVECHGSIHHFQCLGPCGNHIWEAVNEEVNIDESTFRALDPLPRCPHCSKLARPNVLMFGDWMWVGERTQAQDQKFSNWLNDVSNSSSTLAVIEVGAGTAIPTVRNMSERVSHQLKGTLVRINPTDESVSAGHVGLRMGAAEGIQNICEQLAQHANSS